MVGKALVAITQTFEIVKVTSRCPDALLVSIIHTALERRSRLSKCKLLDGMYIKTLDSLVTNVARRIALTALPQLNLGFILTTLAHI